MSIKMARPRKAKPEAHGSTKKPWQFMLTEEASVEIDEVAERLGITRSEALERAIRGGGMKAAEQYVLSEDCEANELPTRSS